MNKLLIGILIGLAVIILLLTNLTRIVQGPPERLGARENAAITRIASTTLDGLGTYFGACCADMIRTATTTLLTANGLHFADAALIDITNVSTTSSAGGLVYIQPQFSLDASTWVPFHYDTVTNTGTFNSLITLNSGTASTTFVWSPGVSSGTTTTVLPPLTNLPGNYLRVRVWTTGTSTITAGIRLISN